MEQPTASTQEHLDIYDIKDDTLILKNGAATAVIETSAINFELLSQKEQDAAIYAYSGLLNSITFPMQVIIKSRKMDISDYIAKIEKTKENTENKMLLEAIKDYQSFVKDMVKNFEILDKDFYVCVTYNKNLIVPGEGPFNWLKDLLGLSHKEKASVDTLKVLENAKPQLTPKVEHLIKEFRRININAKRLNTEELIKLFYESYNPENAIPKNTKTRVQDYSNEMVESL